MQLQALLRFAALAATTIAASAQNDDCVTATAIALGSPTPFDTLTATPSAEPWACTTNTSNDVWFSFTAPASYTASASTCNMATYDTRIEVFDGSCGALNSIACNDDAPGCAGLTSFAAFPVIAGAEYFVRVGGFNSSSMGAGDLVVSGPGGAAPNEECSGAIAVGLGATVFDTTGALASTPAWPCALGGADLWYSYTATSSLDIEISTCGTGYDTALEAFSGTCGALASIACNDDACGLQSMLTIPNVTTGTTYVFRVGGFNGSSGAGQFLIRESVTHFGGLAVANLGSSDLGITGGALRVSNLGSSGLDGVSINLTESGGGRATGDPAFMSYFPQSAVGAQLVTTFEGTLAGGAPTTLVTLTGEDLGNQNLEVTGDFAALGVTTVTVEVYQDGALVDSVAGVSAAGPIIKVCPDPSGPTQRTPWWIWLGMGINTAIIIGTVLVCTLCGTYPMLIGGSMIPVHGDSFRIIPENPTVAVESINTMEMRTIGIPEMTITELGLEQFGFQNVALGEARMDASMLPSLLRVSNLGSSGQDGVRMNIDPSSAAAIEWDNLGSPASYPQGAFLEVEARGTLAQGSGDLLGKLRMTHQGQEIEVTSDYSAVGSTTRIVEVYNAGQLVQSVSGHTGPSATFAAWPTNCKKQDIWGGGSGQTSCFASCWQGALAITIPGVGTFVGDELRVLAEGGAAVESLTSISLTTGGIGEITLTGESATPISTGIGTNYCMANPNSTGATGTASADGSATVADNDVTLVATDLPPGAFAFFITSTTQGFVPFAGGSQGNLCVLGNIGRYVGPGQILLADASGRVSIMIDLTAIPQPTSQVAAMPGETWNFQLWHRDAVGGTAVSNFTDGLAITFL